jgi:hypothetical protein
MVVLAHTVEPGGEYLTLADGRTRTLSKPKKKKAMHVQPTNTVVDISVGPRGLQDADIRKLLKAALGEAESETIAGFSCGKEVSPCVEV